MQTQDSVLFPLKILTWTKKHRQIISAKGNYRNYYSILGGLLEDRERLLRMERFVVVFSHSVFICILNLCLHTVYSSLSGH